MFVCSIHTKSNLFWCGMWICQQLAVVRPHCGNNPGLSMDVGSAVCYPALFCQEPKKRSGHYHYLRLELWEYRLPSCWLVVLAKSLQKELDWLTQLTCFVHFWLFGSPQGKDCQDGIYFHVKVHQNVAFIKAGVTEHLCRISCLSVGSVLSSEESEPHNWSVAWD